MRPSFVSIIASGAWAGGMGRIVGGTDVTPQFKYPWLAAIFRYGEHACGGTMLRQNKVLTAAHCVGGAYGQLEHLEVQLHRHDLSRSLSDEKGYAFAVTKRWLAAGYDNDRKYNDVVILETNSPGAGFSEVILDPGFTFEPGVLATVIGWGALRAGGRSHHILQEVRLPIVAQNICRKAYHDKENYDIQASQFCAGYAQGGKDACQGDSGGPLIVLKDKRPVLIGIVTSGMTCAAPEEPGLYMRVANYSSWIKDVLSNKISPTQDLEL
ncbi:Prostasin [Entomophthora muscae]|uniref:Prostasin n=1 Tax=Entomophthora muscae TaxID=34485 RepID=A0ACC2S107_9FUNG|nr:Prostasin [Entomophthora muscae]